MLGVGCSRLARALVRAGRAACARLSGLAEKRRDGRADQHETEYVETIVEGHQRRFAPDDRIERGDGLLPGRVGIASGGDEMLRERLEAFLRQRIVGVDG